MILGVTILSYVGTSALLQWQIERLSHAAQERDLMNRTQNLAQVYRAMANRTDPTWLIWSLEQAEDARLCLYTAAGRLMADSHGSVLSCRSDEMVALARSALQRDDGAVKWLSRDSGSKFRFAAAVPIWSDRDATGILLAMYATDKYDPTPAVREAMLSSVAVFLTLGLALVCILLWCPVRTVSKIVRFAVQVGNDVPELTPGKYAAPDLKRLIADLNQHHLGVRRMVRSLDTEQRRLRAILHAMTDGVIVMDGSDIILVNRIARDVLGWDPEKLPVPLDEAAVDPDLRADLKSAVRGKTFVQVRQINQRQCLVSYTYAADDQTSASAVAVIRDLTEHVRLQLLREHFTTAVAHELRGPLANMSLISEGLMSGTIAPEDAMQYISRLREEILYLRRLVNDILDLSQIDAGVLTIPLEPVAVGELAAALSYQLSESLARAGLQLHIEAEPATQAMANRERLQQVLRNLLENAMKFTPSGGMIRIAATQYGEEVQIAVADSGPGIASEHLPYIFDRFFKADTARTHSSDVGTGLGLSLVKELVELQGGSVTAGNQRGGGAVFTIRLHAAPRDAAIAEVRRT